MIRTWRFDTPSQTLVLASFDDRLPAVVYWSAPLPEVEDLRALAASTRVSPTGGMLDVVADISVAPEQAGGFLGHPAIRRNGVPLQSVFTLEFAQDLPDGAVILYRDEPTQTQYELTIRLNGSTNVIALWATIKTLSDSICEVDWMPAPVLPAPQNATDILEFSGRWCGEFQTNRVPWSKGARLRESWEGRTSHTDFPGILIPTTGATQTQGEAFGFHLGWSGGHRMIAEELSDGRRQVQFGALQDASVPVTKDNPYSTPKLYVTRSGAGLNGVSQSFHAHVREEIVKFPDPERPRPVHYNCWEAVYFDHKPQVLKDLATRAAGLGVERFVLDDGWFGQRDDDTTSLGDWSVDPRKWPDGLGPLIDHVKSLGMTFGLWVEPEMVNEESDLFRSEPKWMLGTGRYQGRNQQVLNLSNPQVAQFLFERIDNLLNEYDIDYLKWDHNRALPSIRPAQTESLYALFSRIHEAHPNVEIETCASGGARIDFGILEHTERFWTSDSNDAYERWKIQRGASYFFPPEIAGSHIGPRVCHTSGRQFPMSFRASVAASRAMGLEMDLRELTDDEADLIKQAIARFKDWRSDMRSGLLHRLDSDDANVLAEVQVAPGQDRFMLYSGQMQPSAQQFARPLRLAGLTPDALYDIRLENADEVEEVMNRGAKSPLIAGETVRLSGAYLMHNGLQLPNAFPNTIWVLTGERI